MDGRSSAPPPFPSDVPVAAIQRISLQKLQRHDAIESQRLFAACRESGFFKLVVDSDEELGRDASSHAVSTPERYVNASTGDVAASTATPPSQLRSLLRDVFALNAELHALPEEEKERSAYSPPAQLFGYKALGRNRVEGGAPDRYEAWTLARDDILGLADTADTSPCDASSENAIVSSALRPPPRPPLGLVIEARRSGLSAYVRAMHAIVMLVCAHLERHLGLPDSALAQRQALDQPSQTSIRLLRYLPHVRTCGDHVDDIDQRVAPRKSLVGHTDIGTMTVLAHNGVGGLQVLPPGRPNIEANWVFVRPEEGCLLVNLGDAMAEWSGHRLCSDLHRVVAAPGAQAEAVRYSVAYLVRPASEALMEPLKSEWRAASAGDQRVWTALEWERRKSEAIISGRDVARTKGGIVAERSVM